MLSFYVLTVKFWIDRSFEAKALEDISKQLAIIIYGPSLFKINMLPK